MAGILDLFGGNTDAEDRKAEEKIRQMGQVINDIDTPVFEDIVPELYDYQGDLNPVSRVNAQTISAPDKLDYQDINPYLADTFLTGDSEFNDISTDPRLLDNQMAALASLQGIVDSGGMTAAETANLARIQGDVASADKGRRDAILQGMQQRGQSGGGLELLAQLQSSQAATDQASQAGLDINAQAQQRALDAIMSQGSLSGQMRGQDFGEKSAIAQAQDAINRFNTQNKTSGSQFNAGVTNNSNQFNTGNRIDVGKFGIQGAQQAKQFNAGQEQGSQQFNANTANDFGKTSYVNKQDVANMNTDTGNKAMYQNKIGTPQTGFENSLSKASGQQKAFGAEADLYGNIADRKKKEAAETLGAVTKGATAIGGAAIMASDERVKEDIAKVSIQDIEEFFSAIEPKSFQYKLNEYGEGEKVGFMIQDIENTKLGKKIVREIDGVKYYDKQGLDGILLSAVSLLMNERNK